MNGKKNVKQKSLKFEKMHAPTHRILHGLVQLGVGEYFCALFEPCTSTFQLHHPSRHLERCIVLFFSVKSPLWRLCAPVSTIIEYLSAIWHQFEYNFCMQKTSWVQKNIDLSAIP
jgi:hypothetical protein